MTAYYNENDPKAAAWLRELIAAGLISEGDVDERSIEDVRPDDLAGYVQCHFFAGIGGWSYALRLAGWADDRPVWTGSCPCQALSAATRGRRAARDWWPVWYGLIVSAKPRVVLGEQVARREWFDRASDDMEALGYAIGAAVLPAVGVGQDHIRERIYFVCDADGHRKSVGAVDDEMAWLPGPGSEPAGVVSKDGLSDRMAVMRGFGNAIVPQVAAEFVSAFMELSEGQVGAQT